MEPDITVWHEKDGRTYETMKNDRINYNNKNAEFCFDFVIESSLKLQNLTSTLMNYILPMRVTNEQAEYLLKLPKKVVKMERF
jgi:hypothetical protein